MTAAGKGIAALCRTMRAECNEEAIGARAGFLDRGCQSERQAPENTAESARGAYSALARFDVKKMKRLP